MAVVLLDTSVASLLLPQRRARPERALYDADLRGQTLALSFQSVAELWKLAEKNSWSEPRKSRLEAFVQRFLVIPFDHELTRVWARIAAHEERLGRPMDSADLWIAATAVHRSLTLYTHDSDFLDRTTPGLTVVSYLER